MSILPERFQAFVIGQQDGQHQADLQELTLNDLAEGDVLIKVHFSAVNYKDALAGTGTGKILRTFPLIGGIDLSGEVIRSDNPDFSPGDLVLMTGSGLSETENGGYSEYQNVNSQQLIPLPVGLNLQQAMIIGTAGFTAALALHKLELNGLTPDHGPVLITGATGGVGSLAVNIFSQAGYEVHALSGKPDQFDYLKALGAKECIDRQNWTPGHRPMESAIYAGALDNCGGDILAGILRHLKPRASVASCGLVTSHALSTTVMPFIIRGNNLLGINSAATPIELRQQIWQKLANEWKPEKLDEIHSQTITLNELPQAFEQLIAGSAKGRILVQIYPG